ncbi:glycosyltransferase [Actinomadura hibisca]|uniref:PdmS n=1 Tax=Actinomadura hibisca TaxID=68565 RepID=A0SZV9_9ACTN|nr:glycosyltransferase [Actinomadura hibisca]ABK58688.1 PdmS [Actinomadura hibisca]
MANILISTMPESGHVNPALPIAAALTARGHRVRWHTGAEYTDTIEATGARLVPMRHAPRFRELPPRRDPSSGWDAVSAVLERLYVAPSLGQLRDFQEILADFPADVVFNESTAGLGGHLLHDLGGPPWARLGVSMPPTLPDSPIPPLYSPRLFTDTPELLDYSADPAAIARYRELNHEVAHVHLRPFTDALNALRAEVGLAPMPPGRTALDATISPFLHVQTGTPTFDYPRDELPPQIRHVGPLLPPPSGAAFDPPPWWPEVTSGDQPVVHVTQGTVATDLAQLLAPTLAGLAGEDVLVVATTPDPAALGPLPDNVRVAPSIPYAHLLPLVDVMITNGGIGGVLAALAQGVPLVATGRTEDKPAICARIAYTGVGVDLRSAAPEPDAVRAAVKTVLSDPSYRRNAERIGADFARHDPPAEAADLLERLARTRRPVIA